MSTLEKNVENRRYMLERLRAEVVGPDPSGLVRTDPLPSTMTRDDFWDLLPFKQEDGEEVLGDAPTRRYGAAILHPRQVKSDESDDISGVDETESVLAAFSIDEDEDEIPQQLPKQTKRMMDSVRKRSFQEPSDDDSDVLTSRAFKPSAFGLSMVLVPENLRDGITILLASMLRTGAGDDSVEMRPCGHYLSHEIGRQGDEEDGRYPPLWFRRPLFVHDKKHPSIHLTRHDLSDSGNRTFLTPDSFSSRLELRWHRRSWPEAPEGQEIFTFTLINHGSETTSDVAASLFQAGLSLELEVGALADYPGSLLGTVGDRDPSDDALVAELLYHRRKVLAVGHGCSADWNSHGVEGKRRVWASFMPVWEIPPISFEARDRSKKVLHLSMRELAGLQQGPNDGLPAQDSLEALLDGYSAWVDGLDGEPLPECFKATGIVLKERCVDALSRMRKGLELLDDNEDAARAFRLANLAMLMSQHRRPKPNPRKAGDETDPYDPLDIEADKTKEREKDENIGLWRPFQLAFLLMSIPDIISDEQDEDSGRDIVDLIWFPTGGGKTEAYLGLAAFTVFYNRITERELDDSDERRSSTILMRYTLRLLTAQQFQRAVTLFCAMELIRHQAEYKKILEGPEFNVGLWVGGSVSPNRNEDARRRLSVLEGRRNADHGEDADANPFVLLQCPWCSTAFGRVGTQRGRGRTRHEVAGYKPQGKGNNAEVIFRCDEGNCEYGAGRDKPWRIPALVVDEQIYNSPPSLLISTVDKFAQLAWNENARSLLGIDGEGRRAGRPPELIIQDELHLISGPLGTMVGHFESAIDFLCRHDRGQAPKIIASTATAAYAGRQVRALYGRNDLRVFPPSGIDAADSYFAVEVNDRPGRLYAGVLAPDHGSMQTTQRHVYAALLQGGADMAIKADEKADEKAAALDADPWWTILCYYNSIRELGGALTLFGADVLDQLKVIRQRRGLLPECKRSVNPDHAVMELTSRIRSDEVPEVLRMLSRPIDQFRKTKGGKRSCWAEYGSGNGWAPIQDACLASNMIEVGVDVDRLALMVIVGQPKTTSSYIQASSRVGRKGDRPGLVVTLYSNTKPRDRSHFERFRSYHQAIYQWVEPTSVTPFSIPVVERALKAVLVTIARQASPSGRTPQEVGNRLSSPDDDEVSWPVIKDYLESRCRETGEADNVELNNLKAEFNKLHRQWLKREPTVWGNPSGDSNDGDPKPLMHPSGSVAPPSWSDVWRIPHSLRAVDSTCEAEITQFFARSEEE